MKTARTTAVLAALLPGGLWLHVAQADTEVASAAPVSGASGEGVQNLEAARAGRRLYMQNCSHCHGFNMVNPGTVSFDLRRFPLDDPQRFFHSVTEGKDAMPAWKDSLQQSEIELIWAYVQTRGKL